MGEGTETPDARPDTPSPTSGRLRQVHRDRFDEIVGQTLELASAAGALLYLFFTLLHPVYFDPPQLYVLLGLGGITTGSLAALWWWTRYRKVEQAWVQPAVAAGLGLVLLNAVAVSAVRRSPEMTVWFALVILAAGLLLLSRRWFAGLVVAVVTAWLWVATHSPPDPGWTQYAPFVLLSAIVLGAITLASRRRIYGDLIDREHRLRRVNRELDRARRKAERAENLQSRFLANVSHDVRTPASAIIGEARQLHADARDEAVREKLATIEDSAYHLVRLFDDILDISMAEAGQLSVRDEAFALERLLRQCLDTVATPAREKGLGLSLEIDEDVPDVVRTDSHRLRQILTNLLSNAVKFTEEGRVEVRVQVERRQPLGLRFEVEDTGPGIPRSRQGELFRAFSRLDTSPDIEGTGLGLAICQRLTKLLGGDIGVDSVEGEGSVFWFTVPVDEADPDEIDQTSGPVRLTGRTVWLVGTEEEIASGLGELGFRVERMAGIGFVEEALEGNRRPSLIVLDLTTIQAPEDFLAERVRSWREREVPVIVVKKPDAEIEALEEIPGPGGVITSSIEEDELREILSACLERAGGVSPAASRPDPEMGERHPLSILMVEDSPVNRRLVEGTLQRLGYEPDGAGDGEEALALLDENRYDLVFLDLGLPGTSGIELARRVLSEHEPPPRLVALTGFTDEATIEEAREAGIEAHLTKPVQLEDIVDQLDQTQPRKSDTS